MLGIYFAYIEIKNIWAIRKLKWNIHGIQKPPFPSVCGVTILILAIEMGPAR
jgi:hypothetical protein